MFVYMYMYSLFGKECDFIWKVELEEEKERDLPSAHSLLTWPQVS